MILKKIFIPFHAFKASRGGPQTFMQNLQGYLDKEQFHYCLQPEEGCSIFFPIVYDMATLKLIKSWGGKVIQRLDGIFYPSKHGQEFEKLNAPIQEIYHNWADYIIFQSQYSQAQCFEMFGSIPENKYSIILNGVNEKLFSPNQDRQFSMPNCTFITTGNIRNLDMIEPVILAMDQLVKTHPVRLKIVGPIANPSLNSFLDRNYVDYVGSQDLQGVANELRQADVFIYSHLNPPCPNSVLEAVSVGLPVVGFASGAMRELLSFNKELLAPVSNDIFQTYDSFQPERLLEKFQLVLSKYADFRDRALKNSLNYRFDHTGRSYQDVFNKVMMS